jgi:hypothetical protein
MKNEQVLDYNVGLLSRCNEDGRMNKDRTICFRTSHELRSILDKIAGKQKRSVSSTIEVILRAHLENRKALRPADRERRRFQRKTVNISTMIEGLNPDETAMQLGVILDVSLSGLCISVPDIPHFDVAEDRASPPISVVFALPKGKKTVTLQCAPRHALHRDADMHIGASIMNADFTSYQTLQNYLIG